MAEQARTDPADELVQAIADARARINATASGETLVEAEKAIVTDPDDRPSAFAPDPHCDRAPDERCWWHYGEHQRGHVSREALAAQWADLRSLTHREETWQDAQAALHAAHALCELYAKRWRLAIRGAPPTRRSAKTLDDLGL